MLRRCKIIITMLACIVSAIVLAPCAALAETWNYSITEENTPEVINRQETRARIDTENHEILLPFLLTGDAAAFAPDGSLEYAVLTNTGVKVYSWDGEEMAENTLLEIEKPDLLALAMPEPYPGIVVADKTSVKHYAFTGSGMEEVPCLEVSGLTEVMSVSAMQRGNLALIDKQQVKVYSYDGNNMVENIMLAPEAEQLDNPLGVCMVNEYDVAVMDGNEVKYFNLTGSGMVENPAMSVTGLNNPKAFYAVNGEISVVDGTEVKDYMFTGSEMAYNSVLSITSGLTDPSTVVLRPGSYDRLIIDGNKVKYFSWNGSELVENPDLSIEIEGIIGKGYRSPGEVVSNAVNPEHNATHVRVRAYQELPEKTSITWSVTADGANWQKSWRIRGTASGTIAEATKDNGATWETIGGAAQVSPAVDSKELWTEVTPGSNVAWKAELVSEDKLLTPKIYAQLGSAVVWETNTKPLPPQVDPIGEWIYTTTPTFTWTFNDLDTGDSQSAFQVVIRKASDGSLVYDSGKVISDEKSFTLSTSKEPDVPGPLWDSGEYSFTLEMRTWDQCGVASDWSTPRKFNVLAFERPRVAEIVSPPQGQYEPDVGDDSTHIMIEPEMGAEELPKAKAGARVTVILDSVGPFAEMDDIKDIATITCDSGGKVFIGEVTAENDLGNNVNRWTISFWTDADIREVPTGTIVEMQTVGTGLISGSGSTIFDIPPYADGIIRTEGSIYENWFVILEGKN